MRIKGPGTRQRGMAILITLTVIALLMTIVMQLNQRVSSSLDYTSTSMDRVTMSFMAASGIHLGMAMLVKDKQESDKVDSLHEDWADQEIIDQAVGEIPFDQGTLKMTISDELAKIQVNALVKFPGGQSFNQNQMNMWERFISYIRPMEGMDDSDTSTSAIINSIKDWLDSGDDGAVSGVNGAESDYYQDLTPPYLCRNGPLASIDELVLIKGVGKLLSGIGGLGAISKYITIIGMVDSEGKKFTYPGKININTAELPVIAALLPVGHADLAQDIISFREERSEGHFTHDLATPDWYKKAPGIGGVIIDPELITIKSDFFRIEAVTELHGAQFKATAVVQREKDKKSGKYMCRVLSWVEE